MPEIRSWSEARDLGLKRYYTGRPCRAGHVGDRFVSGHQCVRCIEVKRPKRRRYPDRVAIANREYWKQHRDELNAKRRKPPKQRLWADRNEYQRIYLKNRKRHDVSFKLRCLLSTRICLALQGKAKPLKTEELLGATVEQVRRHIERMFTREMTWGNWGSVWELDHIIPFKSFNMADPAAVLTACNFTNLRPLLKRANRSKGARRELLL